MKYEELQNIRRDRACDLGNPDYIGDLSSVILKPLWAKDKCNIFRSHNYSFLIFPSSPINLSPYYPINHFASAKLNF